MPMMACRTRTLRHGSIPRRRLSANGANDSSSNAWRGSTTLLATAGRGAFPPTAVIAIKALACEAEGNILLEAHHDTKLNTDVAIKLLPEHLARDARGVDFLKREALARGIVASIGETTIWRWLSQDGIKPWNHRSWVFPRDPDFVARAGRLLDLYEGRWEGCPLGQDDWVISADEKTSLQARRRCHPTLPPAPGRAMRVEHEYERRGALAYLAAWDVKQARIFGRCEASTGIEPFGRLVLQVMWKNLVLVHTPVHASWLNQVEIYFSVLQRKVLTPSDFASTEEVEDRILRFQHHYEQVARPFQWKFTRSDLQRLMERLEHHVPANQLAA